MRKFTPTFDFAAYRVKTIDVDVTSPDEFFAFRVKASPIREPEKEIILDFTTDLGGRGKRFRSLAAALGIEFALILEEYPGRVFAMKNCGKEPDDFASLEYASACLQSDRQAFAAANAYAAECAGEEEADAAMAQYVETGIEAFSRKAARCAA
ncbi:MULTISPECIES: hypothetical protein [unclassified Mesorhizobium]|uniref:hypothetical protein n=1 Tax=unclassified Mesorhizobium TaxID=325217 RepID=UPI000FD95FB1|nr:MULTISPECIES: hypothetical protein [unclassified Mesorhizobium]TGR58277.1 hypothetical protein EN842_01405 [bacterium M00.F.Ca.ET.199.01.1.1]TGU41615.1 hypothetical protein EN799_03410 [bacterium M00.F.Ca.ET.156.01.1.1]TGV89761.1 hypothetical protein EN792_006275 [Mesorhizobium sp. M00.F.Ca.ET.149.01.1.1]TGR33019.1 hypothetical protein EN840_01405 [Mesorhizobium sp. M8A.F.Ca.ET.197.01.1.1]TGR34665.1 hypothetical protein EN845_01405 [Mesorhizobium sp. M8A.F.Ca.ET.202.01.1.1]